MAVTCAAIMKKKTRKTPADRRIASLLPVSPLAVELNLPNGAPERSDSFDPHLHLTKLSVRKTTRAYQADEFVFSQGDAADAVFYIESGKVKLTVVSKSGKEAVVAILLEGSFFGEGCLAGQPLRMATASTLQPSTILRVEKREMVALLHRDVAVIAHAYGRLCVPSQRAHRCPFALHLCPVTSHQCLWLMCCSHRIRFKS